MTTSEVLISVVIPAYNYGKTLPRAAESVLRQLDEHAELIIIDDGSTDDTPVVVAALEQTYPGRFRAIRQVNAGLAAVRNRGIDEANGSYLVFLDADDEMVDGALALLLRHIAENPDSRLIIGGHISVYANGRRNEHTPDPLPATAMERVKGYLLEKTLGVSNGACAMHREVFGLGRYPERFRNAEDIPVFAQVFAAYPCTLLHSPLALIYKHEDSLRHNLSYGMQIGEQLIGEVFDSGRLPAAMQVLKKPFTAQRYLSLFRTFLTAGETQRAREFYSQALKADWRAVLRWSYTRKAIKLWLGGGVMGDGMQRKPLKYYWQVEVLDGADQDFSWVRLWRRVRRNRPAHFLFWFRLAEHLSWQRNRMFKSLAKGINNRLIQRHGIEIMLGAEIAEGLRLSHMQGVVIFRTVRIGRNFTIRQNTTIGTDFKSDALLIIGDNVDVGANSCIIGSNIHIGDNVTLGAMSFVNKSIPANQVYITEKQCRLIPKSV